MGPCKGVDHMDFSADGRYLIASCEFGGAVIKVDVEQQQVLGRLPLNPRGHAAGREAIARRHGLLRRRHGCRTAST